MDSALLVDTNFSSAPIYKYLIESGIRVIVVGSNKNDTIAKYATEFINIDYSKFEELKKLVSNKKIKYVIPGCNDISYLVCAKINEDNRFQGIDKLENAIKLIDKDKFRVISKELNIPVPELLKDKDLGQKWPIIIKPVDSFSGMGVTVLHEKNYKYLPSAILHAKKISRTGRYLIEEYVEGKLYSHSAFLRNQSIIEDYVVEEHGIANPFAVDTSRVAYDFPKIILKKIQEDIIKLSKKLNLSNGIIHSQFIVNNDKYWIIEVTRRCPGDLYSKLIEFSTGQNYAKNYVSSFINQEINLNQNLSKNLVVRHTLTSKSDFIYDGLEFKSKINIRKFYSLAKFGDELKKAPKGRMGILFLEQDTIEEHNKIFSRLLDRSLYSLD